MNLTNFLATIQRTETTDELQRILGHAALFIYLEVEGKALDDGIFLRPSDVQVEAVLLHDN